MRFCIIGSFLLVRCSHCVFHCLYVVYDVISYICTLHQLCYQQMYGIFCIFTVLVLAMCERCDLQTHHSMLSQKSPLSVPLFLGCPNFFQRRYVQFLITVQLVNELYFIAFFSSIHIICVSIIQGFKSYLYFKSGQCGCQIQTRFQQK